MSLKREMQFQRSGMLDQDDDYGDSINQIIHVDEQENNLAHIKQTEKDIIKKIREMPTNQIKTEDLKTFLKNCKIDDDFQLSSSRPESQSDNNHSHISKSMAQTQKDFFSNKNMMVTTKNFKARSQLKNYDSANFTQFGTNSPKNRVENKRQSQVMRHVQFLNQQHMRDTRNSFNEYVKKRAPIVDNTQVTGRNSPDFMRKSIRDNFKLVGHQYNNSNKIKQTQKKQNIMKIQQSKGSFYGTIKNSIDQDQNRKQNHLISEQNYIQQVIQENELAKEQQNITARQQFNHENMQEKSQPKRHSVKKNEKVSFVKKQRQKPRYSVDMSNTLRNLKARADEVKQILANQSQVDLGPNNQIFSNSTTNQDSREGISSAHKTIQESDHDHYQGDLCVPWGDAEHHYEHMKEEFSRTADTVDLNNIKIPDLSTLNNDQYNFYAEFSKKKLNSKGFPYIHKPGQKHQLTKMDTFQQIPEETRRKQNISNQSVNFRQFQEVHKETLQQSLKHMQKIFISKDTYKQCKDQINKSYAFSCGSQYQDIMDGQEQHTTNNSRMSKN